MHILQDDPDIAQRELTGMLGMSVGGLSNCLNALMDKSFVKVEDVQKSKNKFKCVYLPVAQGIAEKAALAIHFLECRMDKCEALKVKIEALKVGLDGLRCR